MSDRSDDQRPMVFISHASEDKERFVEPFSRDLMSKGINVWLDKWEMFPGDSLIEKIFDEGLKGADAIIIVLSENSVNKPWVREELNNAIVRKIESKTRVIPIVLDGCSVPACLTATVWQPIKDIENYEPELARIVASILRTTEKPEIGNPPKYASSVINVLPGLSKEDTLVFQVACEAAIENERLHGDTNALQEKVSGYDITPAQLRESLEMLDSAHLIKLTRVMGGGLPLYQVTPHGLHEYCQSNIPEYDQMVKSVICELVNNSTVDSNNIAKAVKLRTILVENILVALSDRGIIKITRYIGGILVNPVSPQLKRMAEEF